MKAPTDCGGADALRKRILALGIRHRRLAINPSREGAGERMRELAGVRLRIRHLYYVLAMTPHYGKAMWRGRETVN